jgi:hypothetical protein
MSAPIKIFQPNFIDMLNNNVTITVTDAVAENTGASIIDYLRNRSINNAWITTGSTDAANTQLDVDMGDEKSVDSILIINHNLKSYAISYWNGSAYVSAYTISNDAKSTSFIQLDPTVSTSKIRIVIAGTQTANEDKYISRLIISEEFGTFSGWPKIVNPTHGTNKSKTTLLSGLVNIVESTGAFKCELNLDYFDNAADLALVEAIYSARKGLNFWLCGGDELQFKTKLKGYRLSDVYLMRPDDDYQPEWNKGIYTTSIKQKMSLVEVVR